MAPTQIAVHAGEVIGLYGNVCAIDNSGTPSDQFGSFSGAEPAVGDSPSFFNLSAPAGRADVSATFEPTPTSSTTSTPSGVTGTTGTTVPTGQRAAALKSCKKKFRHNAEKLHKCKKKANLLPV